MSSPTEWIPVQFSRRELVLAASATLGAGSVSANTPLIASISTETIRPDGAPAWFHPRGCRLPDGRVLMTLQTISGSDTFGPVCWMETRDLGRTWSEPQEIPGWQRRPRLDGLEAGVCDVVPEWHPNTRSVLAVGHNVFYRGGKFFTDQPRRQPVYAVWKDGRWASPQILEWDDPRGSVIYTNNCGQRVTLPNGDVLLCFTHTGDRKTPRSVSSIRCTFDGERLTVRQVGDEVTLRAGRGLLEPSLTHWKDRFYLTLRAEDGRGYVTRSIDGMSWEPIRAWAWGPGAPLEMSTTQQHWVTHSGGLFLAYTRKDPTNLNVPRWRVPIWISEVDPQDLTLRRETERVVLPLQGDGVNAPEDVPFSGNFHPVAVSAKETWISDGQMRPRRGYRGPLLLARIAWSSPNRLVAPLEK